MGRPRGTALPKEANELKDKIQGCRTTRRGHEHFPKVIWTEAIRLARVLGACRAARAVGLDYKGLCRKITLVQARTDPAPQRFVELPAEVVLPRQKTLAGPPAPDSGQRTLVEVTAVEGHPKLTPRIASE
jgi:hypothetical protein